jgi:pSer/pThr/pTyr-binding forkhead associated (FHA) protein
MFLASPLTEEIDQVPDVLEPAWLSDARDALVAIGDYLAYEAEERVRVLPLQDGWTRVGRSLSAHVRFDDPTVSRRHALIHSDRTGARILDDRSLNGVFVNGKRIDWRELDDGDEIAVGAFRLYYVRVGAKAEAEVPRAAATG